MVLRYDGLNELRGRILFKGSFFDAALSYVFNYQKYHDMKRWKDLPLVEAEVLECSPEHIDGNIYVPYVRVNFAGSTVDFPAVRSKRRRALKIGSKIVILYDVRDPGRSIDLENCSFLEVIEVCRV